MDIVKNFKSFFFPSVEMLKATFEKVAIYFQENIYTLKKTLMEAFHWYVDCSVKKFYFKKCMKVNAKLNTPIS